MFSRRLIPALLMVSTFALSAQADAKYADPAGRFTVAVPEKWASANSDTQQIAVVLGKLEGTELQALCVVVVSETPQTVGKSQAEIDDALNIAVRGAPAKLDWEY